ncbi:MAG: isochorismatase family protein [Pirellulaceae bacterium]
MSSKIPTRSKRLLSRERSSLLIIDVQERLLPSIDGGDRVVWNIGRLIDTAKLFAVPINATEQYPKGLGHTVSSLRERLPDVPEKAMFSCRECTQVFSPLLESDKQQMVVTGIETHVCVLQTVMDLIAQGFDVFVVVDAVGSRFSIDRETALGRMQQAGATLISTESVMFEWCESSADPQFKAMSQLARQTGS